MMNTSFEESDDEDHWGSDRAAAWGRWGHWINRETGWGPTHSGDCMIGYHHWRIQEKDSSGVSPSIAIWIGSAVTSASNVAIGAVKEIGSHS